MAIPSFEVLALMGLGSVCLLGLPGSVTFGQARAAPAQPPSLERRVKETKVLLVVQAEPAELGQQLESALRERGRQVSWPTPEERSVGVERSQYDFILEGRLMADEDRAQAWLQLHRTTGLGADTVSLSVEPNEDGPPALAQIAQRVLERVQERWQRVHAEGAEYVLVIESMPDYELLEQVRDDLRATRDARFDSDRVVARLARGSAELDLRFKGAARELAELLEPALRQRGIQLVSVSRIEIRAKHRAKQ